MCKVHWLMVWFQKRNEMIFVYRTALILTFNSSFSTIKQPLRIKGVSFLPLPIIKNIEVTYHVKAFFMIRTQKGTLCDLR